MARQPHPGAHAHTPPPAAPPPLQAHAEAGALAAAPHLAAARVYVHLRSDDPALDRVVEWGRLGDRASWRTATSSVMRSLLSSVLGTVDEGDSAATDGSDGSWSRASFTAASLASWDGEAGLGGGPAGWGAGSWDDGDRPQPRQQQQQQQQQQPAAPPPGACSSSDGGAEQQQGAVAASGDGASACSSGGGGNGSGMVAASSAVSLTAQQAAECSSWLGATALSADGRRRAPGAEVVPAAVSTRPR